MIGLGLILFMVYREVRFRRSLVSALVVAAFFSSHVQMIRTLSEIWCEGLLYLLVCLLWAWSESSPPEKNSSPQTARSTRLAAACFGQGCLAGLLYLTKGTGLQIAFLYWLVLLFYPHSRRLLTVSIAAFLLTCLPLLAWNYHEFGTPFYNFASTHNMWFDEADEIWYDDPETLPTLATYLQSHSFGEIFTRLSEGLWLEGKMALQLLWSDWRLPEGSSSLAVLIHSTCKAAVFLFMGFGLLTRRSHRPVTTPLAGGFFVALCVGLIPSFGWYARLTNEPRFLMTLMPIGIVLGGRFAADGVDSFRAWLRGKSLSPKVLGWIRKTAVTGGVIWGLSAWFCAQIFLSRTGQAPPPRMPELAREILAKLEQLPSGSTIAFGPSHELPTWMARGDLNWRATPWRTDFDGFEKMLAREQIGYVLVDRETAARRPYLAPLVLSMTPPAGWKPLARIRDAEGFFLLYEKE